MSENPDEMSFTWNPRLVKTPTPTMSATTIAVAVIVETVGRTALLAFAVIIKPTPCPHALLPYYRVEVHCFSIYFAAFPRLKNGPAKGFRRGGAQPPPRRARGRPNHRAGHLETPAPQISGSSLKRSRPTGDRVLLAL